VQQAICGRKGKTCGVDIEYLVCIVHCKCFYMMLVSPSDSFFRVVGAQLYQLTSVDAHTVALTLIHRKIIRHFLDILPWHVTASKSVDESHVLEAQLYRFLPVSAHAVILKPIQGKTTLFHCQLVMILRCDILPH